MKSLLQTPSYKWATGVNPLPFEPTLEERRTLRICHISKKGGGRSVSVFTCVGCRWFKRFDRDKILLFRMHGACSIEKREVVNKKSRKKRIRRGRI